MLKVSYLVPLYNKEDYIEECIDSILQEETENLEIEICVVDDGSLDHSLQVVQNRYGDDQRVKIASFLVNKGKNAACNKAFEMSTGDYICLFGADDVVVPGRTEKLLNVSLLDNKAVYGGLIAKDENLKEEYFRQYPKPQSLYSISMRNGLSGGCVIIPIDNCNGVFPIPENLKFEDWWVGYFLVKMDKVSILNEYVTYYRIGIQNDCGTYGGDPYSNVKKDYVRHLDYITELRKLFDNSFLDKSEDLRNSFLGQPVKNIFYFKNFDSISIKIILFKFFGAKRVYDFFYFFKKN
ncbi:glycosyltransferase family 2 protein [Acinetobacter sp. YH1901136]|uniref:glycosyltransferase family 2 protein n=1 Tax=Acinetobacter sp. YH1901136 TaxID=2601200 RepID=UPI0015D3D7CB|nr:glycosyltransferase family 2 protein [Acinetobacter sp. YH1901136]